MGRPKKEVKTVEPTINFKDGIPIHPDWKSAKVAGPVTVNGVKIYRYISHKDHGENIIEVRY